MAHAYQDFERLQRCTACGVGVVPAEQPRVCPSCMAVHTCPRVEDWPPKMFSYLCHLLVKQWFAPFASMTRQAQLEALLKSVFRGKVVEGQMIPRSASADDVWPAAEKGYQEWMARQRAVAET